MKLRFVKFFTSRENEIEEKEEGGGSTTIMRSASAQPGRGQSSLLLLPLQPSSLHLSILSSSTILRQQVPSPPFQLVCRHVPPSSCSSYPSPAVPLFPFFFIKLLKQQDMAYVAWRCTQPAGPACRSSQPVQPQRRPARRTLASSPNQVPRLLSGSNGILSVEDGAIGKQRPKMRFPVSFPSLLNK